MLAKTSYSVTAPLELLFKLTYLTVTHSLKLQDPTTAVYESYECYLWIPVTTVCHYFQNWNSHIL